MSTRASSFVLAAVFATGVPGVAVATASAQSAGDSPQRPPAASEPAQLHDMQHMQMNDDHEMFMVPAREGSGTSWLPDETPMYAIHRQAGSWTLMAHGNAFLQYLHESGDRGGEQFGSINWFMGMADRSVGNGHVGFRGMLSLEPWTIRGCGYPDLLASGEVCQGAAIHDKQHPHDLFMELAAVYDRPLVADVRLQLYGGPVGEPALGPTAFSHRISATPNPLAPITHHWFDATHITYGVVTAVCTVSAGRRRHQYSTVESPMRSVPTSTSPRWIWYSGRLWFLPTSRWALQLSSGHLAEAEAGPTGGPRIDVNRVTASATYHHIPRQGTIWASTLGWGRNQESGGDATNAFLAETNLTVDERDTWSARFELSGKSGHDLAIESHDLFTVAKLQAGYTAVVFRPGKS